MKNRQPQSRWLLTAAALFLLPAALLGSELPQHFELSQFSLDAPPRSGWNLTSQRTESIWFIRIPGDREFTMIGALLVTDVARDFWPLADVSLAQVFINDYRQAAVRGGHGFSNENFESITIGGRRFFASSARLTKVHNLPVDDDFAGDELVYVHIPVRPPGARPEVYLFLLSDFRRKPEPLEGNLRDFLSVLESFDPKDPMPPV